MNKNMIKNINKNINKNIKKNIKKNKNKHNNSHDKRPMTKKNVITTPALFTPITPFKHSTQLHVASDAHKHASCRSHMPTSPRS